MMDAGGRLCLLYLERLYLHLSISLYGKSSQLMHVECGLMRNLVELAWRSGRVLDCHATARGSIPGGNGVFTELHVLRKEQ